MKMMKNAIVAQSGGPTTAINASLAGVIKGCLESHEIDVLYGALNGVEGLMDERLVNLTDIFDHNEENLNVLKLTPAMYLGSCRRKLKDVDQDSSEYDIIINIFRKYHIHYFFYIGGNDSMDTVGKMSRYVKEHQMDVKVIGIPKTIDNDTPITEFSVGFNSACQVCTSAIDSLDATARSHSRALILEVMGRDAGHLAMHSALAGGADVCLVPEIPYKIDSIIEKLKEIKTSGRSHAVLVVSEGIKTENGEHITGAKNLIGENVYGGVGQYLSAELNKRLPDFQTRVTTLGHLQRSGIPTAFDRMLAAVFGAKAVELLEKGETNKMVVWEDGEAKAYSLEEVVKKGTTLLDVHGDYVKAAQKIGMYVGEIKA